MQPDRVFEESGNAIDDLPRAASRHSRSCDPRLTCIVMMEIHSDRLTKGDARGAGHAEGCVQSFEEELNPPPVRNLMQDSGEGWFLSPSCILNPVVA